MDGPSTSSAPPAKPTIKGYEIDELLGQGTFSHVYRAKCNTTGEILALKIFNKEMKYAHRYFDVAKEISVLRVLNHPNIVTLKTFEISASSSFIGMEYASKGSLKTIVEEKELVTEGFIQNTMKQILAALDYMHGLGVLHGDLKPHNILCFEPKPAELVMKLCDFGLADVCFKDSGIDFYTGTSFYMAPEIVTNLLVDVRCDLWSAGVVMYFMMFRRHLFGPKKYDYERHFHYIKHGYKPNYRGFEKYSPLCNSLLNGLLSYSKASRPFNETLRRHPFLNLQKPPTVDAASMLQNVRTHITSCFEKDRSQKLEEALLDGVQARIELRIYHNLITDKRVRAFLKRKCQSYEEFALAIAQNINSAPPRSTELTAAEFNDEKFREYLRYNPKLLDGFAIGCNAEMYLMEGNVEEAHKLFKMALQMMLPLVRKEPNDTWRQKMGTRDLLKTNLGGVLFRLQWKESTKGLPPQIASSFTTHYVKFYIT